MQLTAFRIFKYRNIEDSGLINLFDRLTCIVGKNQSGKTNLLRALQKLNPHDKSVKYDWRADWPRGGRRTRDERQVGNCSPLFPPNDQQVAGSERIVRAARMAAKGLRPLRRPVATMEQRSA
jgi:energy-coupling factor transporter ATP-binding protein EcfA2